MLKNILEIEGVGSVTKSTQKGVNGGKPRPVVASCASTCANASHGTPCGPPHCPGMCTGNGGWVNY
mgnify:CR=1 FL=1